MESNIFVKQYFYYSYIPPIKIRNIRNCIFVKYICNKNIVKLRKIKNRTMNY